MRSWGSTPRQDGLTIPGEIVRRQERKAARAKARLEIETRAKARYAAEKIEYEKKMAGRLARAQRGEKPRGPVPPPPSPEPKPKDQYNFTDPESRIMKSGGNFGQCDKAQAVVEVESRLIVGVRVSQSPNDKQELVPTLAAIPPGAAAAVSVLADSGFFREAAVTPSEQS